MAVFNNKQGKPVPMDVEFKRIFFVIVQLQEYSRQDGVHLRK